MHTLFVSGAPDPSDATTDAAIVAAWRTRATIRWLDATDSQDSKAAPGTQLAAILRY